MSSDSYLSDPTCLRLWPAPQCVTIAHRFGQVSTCIIRMSNSKIFHYILCYCYPIVMEDKEIHLWARTILVRVYTKRYAVIWPRRWLNEELGICSTRGKQHANDLDLVGRHGRVRFELLDKPCYVYRDYPAQWVSVRRADWPDQRMKSEGVPDSGLISWRGLTCRVSLTKGCKYWD